LPPAAMCGAGGTTGGRPGPGPGPPGAAGGPALLHSASVRPAKWPAMACQWGPSRPGPHSLRTARLGPDWQSRRGQGPHGQAARWGRLAAVTPAGPLLLARLGGPHSCSGPTQDGGGPQPPARRSLSHASASASDRPPSACHGARRPGRGSGSFAVAMRRPGARRPGARHPG
jgi:hypothetical protein